jgi:hypothetical protein
MPSACPPSAGIGAGIAPTKSRRSASAFLHVLFRSAQISLVLQFEQDLLHRFVDSQAGGIDRQLGFFR